MEQLSQRLREAREKAELSQQKVADYLGLKREAVTEIEAGRRFVRVHELVAMARLYDASLMWLVGVDDDPRITQIWQTLRLLPSHQIDAIVRLVDALRRNAIQE